MTEDEMVRVHSLLDFWFGKPGDPEYGKVRAIWFQSTPEMDEQCRTLFGGDYEAAARGDLNHWKDEVESCLALVLLLDQMPRNLFREGPQAFATDPAALEVAKYAVAKGYDRAVQPMQRWFFYLPFEHSEDREIQKTSLQLWHTLDGDSESVGPVDCAERHARVIARFGRFPHRNADLGRTSTPEELEFLAGPGAPF